MSKTWFVTGSSRGLGRSFVEAALSRGDKEKWLHNFGRCGRWIVRLTAGTVVPANQERR